jgi:hypothetical protein
MLLVMETYFVIRSGSHKNTFVIQCIKNPTGVELHGKKIDGTSREDFY